MSTANEPGDLQPVSVNRAPSSKHVWTIAIGLIVAGVAALAIDMPAARWFAVQEQLDFLSKPLRFSEAFGHGIGVLMLLVAVFALDPEGRPQLIRIASAAFGSGLAANLGKIMVARTRPHFFDLTKDVFASFTQWLPLLGVRGDQQSFPSSHTATAAGFAVALSWRYPRGRWFFVLLVLLVALQRLNGNSHFVSDVFFGGAVGYLFAHACLPGGIFSKPFDRLEQRMAKSHAASQQVLRVKSEWD